MWANARQPHGVFRDVSLWSATLQSAHVPVTGSDITGTTLDHSTSRQERSGVRRVVQGLRRHPARLTAHIADFEGPWDKSVSVDMRVWWDIRGL